MVCTSYTGDSVFVQAINWGLYVFVQAILGTVCLYSLYWRQCLYRLYWGQYVCTG